METPPQSSPCTTPRTLTSLPPATRSLILAISTDLTARMNTLLTTNRIAAVDVIPIAKDMLDLSTIRCLVFEKRRRQLNTLRQQRQQQRGRSASTTSTLSASAPTWEEMDEHVCLTSRASRTDALPCKEERTQPKKERRAFRTILRRTRTGEEVEPDILPPSITCHCPRALSLMDLEGDILRSFPDDSGDTLVAPELAAWAIGQLEGEVEETNRIVDALLWLDQGEDSGSDERSLTTTKSERVDSMEPEGGFSFSPLRKSESSKSSSGRGVRGWWKGEDVDFEGGLEGSEEMATDERRGTMEIVRLRERRRSRVLGALRKLSLAG